MSEMAKTMMFVGAAVLALVAGFATRPGYEDFDVQAEVGKLLNQFEVEEAKRLKLVTFDKETATSQEFEVAEEDGLWTIPSKQDYPADAVKQMAAAATGMIDREILRVAAESADQHAELGLVDPTSSNLSTSSKGVGTRVTMTDNDGNALADMIIGNKVLDEEDQYYVRNADQDYAYVINFDPEPLATQFEEWIEKDLLKLNAMDIRRLHIKDYSAELMLTLQGMAINWDRRGEMELAFDATENKWMPVKLQTFDPDQKSMVEAPLDENEELDEDKLRELRNGLDDLTIVDVERKPKGLSSDLKAGSDFLGNREAQNSLVQRGFAPVPVQGTDETEILSSEGEIICTMDDGVEYILRFGNLKLATDGESTESTGTDPDAESDDGIHRYLFVMARYNDGILEQPAIQDLPEIPEPSESPSEAAENSDQEQSEQEDAQQDADTASSDAEEPEDTEATDSEDAAEDSEAEDASEAEPQDDNRKQLIAAREAIEAENERLQAEYQEKVDEAQQRVQQLNERFGDWYYVIDNKVYKKIHLSRDDIVKEKDEAEAETADSAANSAPPAGSIPGLPNLPGGTQ